MDYFCSVLIHDCAYVSLLKTSIVVIILIFTD